MFLPTIFFAHKIFGKSTSGRMDKISMDRYCSLYSIAVYKLQLYSIAVYQPRKLLRSSVKQKTFFFQFFLDVFEMR